MSTSGQHAGRQLDRLSLLTVLVALALPILLPILVLPIALAVVVFLLVLVLAVPRLLARAGAAATVGVADTVPGGGWLVAAAERPSGTVPRARPATTMRLSTSELKRAHVSSSHHLDACGACDARPCRACLSAPGYVAPLAQRLTPCDCAGVCTLELPGKQGVLGVPQWKPDAQHSSMSGQQTGKAASQHQLLLGQQTGKAVGTAKDLVGAGDREVRIIAGWAATALWKGSVRGKAGVSRRRNSH